VHLEGGVGALQGDVVAGQLERVGAGDADAEGDLAEPAQATVQRPVARQIADRTGVQVSAAQRGQDANQRWPAPVPPGRIRDPVEQQAQLLPQRRKWSAGQQRRGGVQLQVEPVQLYVDPGIAGRGADCLVQRQRPGGVIDQEQL